MKILMDVDYVDYNTGKSIAELPITHPSHAPCPDMISGEPLEPEQIKRNLFLIQKLREKHGLVHAKR